MLVYINRYHKQIIFCVIQIVSFPLTDTPKGLPTDTTNICLVVYVGFAPLSHSYKCIESKPLYK
jgi:hypothetical protein